MHRGTGVAIWLVAMGLTSAAHAEEPAAPVTPAIPAAGAIVQAPAAPPAAPAPAPVPAISLKISPAESFVAALVYKQGAASAVAHDHAVQARNVTGTGAWHPTDASACKVEVQVKVADLWPDDPSARTKAGLTASGPSAGQQQEILAHILADYQLWATQYATIGFKSTSISGTSGDVQVKGDFTLRGVTKPIVLTMRLTRTEDGVRARGRFRIKQSDYGYDAFSALFGALAVKDEVDIVLDIVLDE